MLKKFFIFIFIFLCLVALAVYVGTRPSVMAAIIKSAVNARVKDWALEDLAFRKITIGQTGFVRLEDLRFTVNQGTEKWQGEVPVLQLDNLESWVRSKKTTVDLSGAQVESDSAQVRGISAKATVTMASGQWEILDGDLQAASASAQGIVLSDLKAKISGNENMLSAYPWSAQWAGGSLNGRLTVSPGNYTIEMQVAQVDLSRIAQSLKDIHGLLDGAVEITLQKGTNAIDGLNGNITAVKGAELQAVFLKPILNYIPRSTQREFLQGLIAQNANVFFDQVDVDLESVERDSLTLFIKLLSKKLNLDLAVTVDLNVEGGLNALVERLPKVLSP